MSATGRLEIVASWGDQLRRRPFDKPMYTALHGTPTILLYLSREAVSDRGLFERIFMERRSWTLWVMAFVKGPFPVLRCVLAVPDNPLDPYFLESPLDIREGDVQAFCSAGFGNEIIDVIATHEAIANEGHVAVAFRARGLTVALRKEVRRLVSHLTAGATSQGLDAGVRAMEQKYASARDGLQEARRVPFTFAGEARHGLIKASY